MGKMSRNKGKRGERGACKALSEALGGSYRRSVQYCGREGAADIQGLEGLHLEVKRVERFNLYDALEQADGDRLLGDKPVVLHRRNLKEWVFVCYVSDLEGIHDAIGRHLNRIRVSPDAESGDEAGGGEVVGGSEGCQPEPES